MDKVLSKLPSHVVIDSWRMHIFSQLPYSDNYKSFKQKRGAVLQPLDRLNEISALPSGLNVGQLPSVADLKAAVEAAFSGRQAPEVNVSM